MDVRSSSENSDTVHARIQIVGRKFMGIIAGEPCAHYGGDLLNSKAVLSAVILPSISSATTLRTSIAASENRIATISALTDKVRYRLDALYIKPLPALHLIPPQGQREQASPSRRAIWWRTDGDLAARRGAD
jgi:hypothetical protein